MQSRLEIGGNPRPNGLVPLQQQQKHQSRNILLGIVIDLFPGKLRGFSDALGIASLMPWVGIAAGQ